MLARKYWYGLFIASLLIILVLSLMPDSGGEQFFPGQDKVAHAIAFCWLFVSGWLGKGRPVKITGLALVLVGYGVLIEILQSFTGYRMAEWGDLLADIIGIVTGVLLRGVAGRLSAP